MPSSSRIHLPPIPLSPWPIGSPPAPLASDLLLAPTQSAPLRNSSAPLRAVDLLHTRPRSRSLQRLPWSSIPQGRALRRSAKIVSGNINNRTAAAAAALLCHCSNLKGDPLNLAAIIAEGYNFSGPAPVIYVSGEESIEQIANRTDRMRITTEDLFLYSTTDVEVRELKNCPHFIAGRGFVLTTTGTVEMEACIMDGTTKKCGAVSGLSTVVNLISLA